MRRGHWLRGNVRTVIPKTHLCVATVVRRLEADPTCYELVGAGLVVGRWEHGRWHDRGMYTFGTADAFWQAVAGELPRSAAGWLWLLQPRQDVVALQFTREVESKRWKRQWWMWAETLCIAVGRLAGKKCRILGVPNWLECVQTDIDEILPQGELLLQTGDLERDAGGELVVKAARRCQHAVGRILGFVHREDLGHLRSTVAGQSLQAYRHLHLNGKVAVHDNKKALALERGAALGLPTRCLRQGLIDEPIYVVDANSMYPWVMANYPYPRKLLWYIEWDDIEQLKKTAETHLLIARVSGEDDENPYLVKRGNRCVWVHELMDDVLVGPDLDRALYRGKLKHVSQCAAYEGAGVFAKWGEWAWDLRDRYREVGDPIDQAIAKALSVSLWGKFASRLERWEECGTVPEGQSPYGFYYWHQKGQLTEYRRAIAGQVDRLNCHCEPYDSIPAISAFVAAYVRYWLAGVIAVAGKHNVVNQVADALHVTQKGWDQLVKYSLIDPKRFGAMKLVKRVEVPVYYAANIYTHDGIWTAAGRKVDAKKCAGDVWEWQSQETLHEAIMRPPAGVIYTERHTATVTGATDEAV